MVSSRPIIMGSAMLMVATASWGAMFPVAQSALAAVDAFHLTLFRYGFGALIFAGILVAAEGWRALRAQGRLPELTLFGTLGYAGFSLLVFNGLPLTTSEHASVIVTLMPLMTALALWIFRGQRPQPATFAAIGLAIVGVVLVVSKGHLSHLFSSGGGVGDGMVFMGALSWMLYTFGASRFAGWSPLRYATMTCLPGAVMIALLTVIASLLGYVSMPSLPTFAGVWPELGFILVFCSVIAVFTWNAGIRALGATNGVLFINLVPVTAFAIGMAQGHTFTWAEIAGSLLTLAAVAVNSLWSRSPDQSRSTPAVGSGKSSARTLSACVQNS
jgi:drug/metabolite transporter (DMT)-like permease